MNNNPDYEYTITLTRNNVFQTDAKLKAWEYPPESPNTVNIILEFDNKTINASSEHGFFDAFRKIRKTLEEKEILACCYASYEYVYPSPMIESMGSAMLAYKNFLGKQAKTEDLINIFDFDPLSIPVTIEKQEKFHQTWLRSLSTG